ncbi:LPXTG cell wall anchor domain-containing protein [Streptococcus sp. NSJ-72]|uniref:LPXTG cell wall anchor domain-containing protein n=1 Tax=Streptococcus sp. NSJ-72 TaxID=2763068 RepID=UPI0016517A99|nr:LPXTG cell wall anchor domain-containing protein [Streptococcus sp. NSJ-72]QNL42094.1 LPXTG cell wall anchor domain-containing protein [Streptococcus sp. NSJ-72]
MTKKQFFAALTVSTLVLTNGGAVLAEATPPALDSSTPGVVAPGPSTPTPSEPNQPAPETPVDPTTPSTNPSEPKPENPGTTPAEPSVPSDPTTPSTDPSTDPNKPTPGTAEPEKPSEDDKKEEPQPKPEEKPAPKPAEEQPKTTDEANQAGKSQVGTTSTSTGQVVQDVAPNKPVYTENGYTIVGVQDSHPVIVNGDGTTSVVEPEVVGATVNEDKTVTVSTATGEKKTLPHTGEKEATLLVAMGMTLLAAVYVMKRLDRKFHSK